MWLPALSGRVFAEEITLCSGSIPRNVITHVLAQHLGGGFAFRSARLDEFLS
jgi:hypothetical protein